MKLVSSNSNKLHLFLWFTKTIDHNLTQMKKKISLTFITLLFSTFLFSQNLAKISDDYNKRNLIEGNIPEKWEDGMRTSGDKGSYEWWYFDAHLHDGSTVVMTFYTKFMTDIKKPFNPYLTVSIDKADGSKISEKIYCDPEDFFASKDSCNVKMGNSYAEGNLKEYKIHIENEDINLTAVIKRTTQSWRPKTGHMVFGADESKEFNWVVPVPQGEMEIEYDYKGVTTKTVGSAYHDHNWGNFSMMKIFNHWYWSRAEIGPYNVIASEMISEKEFNNDNIITFNISKDGETVVDDGELVTLYRTYGKEHPTLKKDVSDDLIFVYNDPQTEYRYEYSLFREKTIVEVDLISASVGNGLKFKLAKMLTSIDPAYFRFTGKAEIRVYKSGKLIEKHTSNKAVWELMYFGDPVGK